MLRYLFFLCLFNFITPELFSQPINVRIDGQIVGYDGKSPASYSLSSMNTPREYLSVYPDSLGRFTILKSIAETKFFIFIYTQNGIRYECKLIVQPNKNYSFISKGNPAEEWQLHSSPDIYTIEKITDNSIPYYRMDYGQMYYNTIDNGTFGSLYHKEWDLSKPHMLLDSLKQKISRKEQIFNQLLKEGKIDESFYRISLMNIQYLYAYQLAQTISDTWQLENFKITDTSLVKQLNEVYPKIFELYPVQGVKIEQVSFFEKYVDKYLLFLADYNQGEFKPQRRKGTSFLNVLQNSKDVLSPEVNKHYSLRNTMSYTASLDSRSAQVARDFLKQNPDVSETWEGRFLEEILLPRAEEFNKYSKESFPADVFILDKDKPVESFEELLAIMKGKPFIIDYWGTWCAPCRNQFQYNHELKSFLKMHGINMVYIAFEYGKNRETWETCIKAYQLSGYHFISNDSFKSDIEKVIGKITGFPTYLIVGPQGQVLENKACYPSEGDKFYIQLKEKLKL